MLKIKNKIYKYYKKENLTLKELYNYKDKP